MADPRKQTIEVGRVPAEVVAERLVAGAAGGPCVDLSGVLVLVPTQAAGRRLREAVVRLAAEAGRGVLAPRVVTPGQFLAPDAAAVAGTTETLLAWLAVLEVIEPEGYVGLFPEGLPFRGFGQRLAFARTLVALRQGVGGAGLDLRETGRALGDDYAEAGRWADLGRLEERYTRQLARQGRMDAEDARRRLAAVPEGVERVVLAGVADLPPLAARVIGKGEHSVEVFVLGAEEDFDVWGRPLAEVWAERVPDWEAFEEQVFLAARPEDAAELLRAILPNNAVPDPSVLAIGLIDRELAPWLDDVLKERGSRLHDPEGVPASRHWMVSLIRECAGFFDEADFASAVRLMRSAPVLAWLGGQMEDFRASEALGEVDRVMAQHFPEEARAAMGWCREGKSLGRGLARLLGLRDACRRRDWVPEFRRFLAEVSAAFADDLTDAGRRELRVVAGVIGEELTVLADLATHASERPVSEWLELLVVAVAGARSPDDPDGIEAAGWLELPWVDAPHLVVAGMNQGLVPEAVHGDAFLPDSVRERLGLDCNRSRLARDAVFLARILAQRAAGRGRVDFVVGQLALNGDPQLPSSLLMRCTPAELPGRVRYLLREPSAPRPEPAWEAGWKYMPERREFVERRISVTAFGAYLECPFQFYLSRGLRMEKLDPAPLQMDAMLFGTLMHSALETFAADEEAREFAEAGPIREFVHGALDVAVARQFGGELPLPLMVQVEAARQRLTAFAEVQAAERRDGWEIRAAEFSFAEQLGREFELGGWTIRGKVDRLDHHPGRGLWRVIDYKTSDKAVGPMEAHVVNVRKGEVPAEYAVVDVPDKKGAIRRRRWASLQLPLYRLMLIESGLDPETVVTGYFNLPKLLSDAGVSAWDGLGGEVAEAAQACALGVLADLDAFKVWPPNAAARYDSFEGFLHPSVLEVVDPVNLVSVAGGEVAS